MAEERKEEDGSLRVRVQYTNWVGRTQWRNIIPVSIRFGVSKFHSIPQWLLLVHDLDRGDDREYAMKDIHIWEPR